MIRRLLARRRFMREHRWAREHLSDFVDAELAPAETERVEEHVAICPQCHRVLATLRRTLRGLRSLRAKRSTDTADAVIERLREEP